MASKDSPGPQKGLVWEAIGVDKWREWGDVTRASLESDPRTRWPLPGDEPPNSRRLRSARNETSQGIGGQPPGNLCAVPQLSALSGIRSGRGGGVSLGQLKELIHSVWKAKEAKDVRNAGAGFRQKPLLEFYSEWLDHASMATRQRLGSTVQVQGQIANAIRRYKGEDWEVALFSRLLRGEVEEDFRFVLMHLRDSIRKLLRMCLKQLHTEEATERLLKSMLKGRLHEDEWGDVVRYLYNEVDAGALVGRLYDHIAKIAPQRARRGPICVRTADDRSILFSDFEHTVLMFHIEAHVSHLRPFVAKVRSISSNGILSDTQFAALAREVAPEFDEAAIDSILDGIDPTGSGKITFSECVAFLPKELEAWLEKQHQSASKGWSLGEISGLSRCSASFGPRSAVWSKRSFQ